MKDRADPKRAGFADGDPDRFAATVNGFLNATELALLVINRAGVITFVNKSAQQMFGYERKEMIGQTLDLIIPSRLRGAHRAGVKRVASGRTSKLSGKTVEVTALRRNGNEFPIELSLSVWNGTDGVEMGGIIRDISEKKEREARLHRLAHYDALTGLPNRRQFNEQLTALLADARPTAVLLLEIEGLKRINDNLGHTVGDSFLQALAVRLPSVLAPDAFLARRGGDDFGVLLPDVSQPVRALAAAADIATAFDTAFSIGDHLLKFGVGIGVALGPEHGADPEELIASADLALTHATHDGKLDFRLFEPEMRNSVTARRALKDELLRAVGASEFTLHYQPEVNLRTGDFIGAEALLRWNHPVQGLLLPGDFLSILESHSLALQVGYWVLEEACKQVANWRAAGQPTARVSVNLFSAQANDTHLADNVSAALKRHGLPPDALEIEVTETIVLDNDDQVLASLRELGERNVRIAFDDFGMGHASLSTLKRFPLTTLKIDRSFVRDVLNDPTDAAIVQALLAMGRGMNLDVVAEGIETIEQQAALITMGCRYGQGFYYGKPMSAEQFLRKLHDNLEGAISAGSLR